MGDMVPFMPKAKEDANNCRGRFRRDFRRLRPIFRLAPVIAAVLGQGAPDGRLAGRQNGGSWPSGPVFGGLAFASRAA
jgi:hypothetical protein